MKNKDKVSLLVFIKNKYKYSEHEERLEVLAQALGGHNVGGGTDLSTGKRDKQYYFKSAEDAKTFLKYPTVQEVILKNDYELVNIGLDND